MDNRELRLECLRLAQRLPAQGSEAMIKAICFDTACGDVKTGVEWGTL